MNQGPTLTKNAAGKPMSHEREEAISLQFFADLQAAIAFHGQLAMMIEDGQYDQLFEPRIKALIESIDNESRVMPVEGFKPRLAACVPDCSCDQSSQLQKERLA